MPTVKLAVGMINPPKVNAALVGIKKALKGEEMSIYEYEVRSGVPLQPVGDEETLRGAIARAKGAYDSHTKKHGVPPDFAIGLESGVAASILCYSDLESFSWIAVYDGKMLGRARTSSVIMPPPITHLILEEGMEMTAAFDYFFDTTDFNSSGGSIGHLTGGTISRATYYEQAVIMAFVPFLWGDLYATMGGDAVVRLMEQAQSANNSKQGSRTNNSDRSAQSHNTHNTAADRQKEEELERQRQRQIAEERGCLGDCLHMLFFAE